MCAAAARKSDGQRHLDVSAIRALRSPTTSSRQSQDSIPQSSQLATPCVPSETVGQQDRSRWILTPGRPEKSFRPGVRLNLDSGGSFSPRCWLSEAPLVGGSRSSIEAALFFFPSTIQVKLDRSVPNGPAEEQAPDSGRLDLCPRIPGTLGRRSGRQAMFL